MDTDALVRVGHRLLSLLDAAGMPPCMAIWMHNLEVDVWKLWMVPPIRRNKNENIGKEQFFLNLSKIISGNRAEFSDFDIGMVAYQTVRNPLVEAIGHLFRAPGFARAHINNSKFNGLLIEECIILRSDL